MLATIVRIAVLSIVVMLFGCDPPTGTWSTVAAEKSYHRQVFRRKEPLRPADQYDQQRLDRIDSEIEAARRTLRPLYFGLPQADSWQ